ncbi:MAG: class I SAM-dependent methyltransferase [Dehalococcoidia bacterium]|nr:MAG: class I SAM-dependent methyltransferase [Dehalococcoidia bacterium]
MPRDDRTLFDTVAELYDRARPAYPAEVFDDVAELAGLREGAHVLEIGCGTGQATVPLARRGYRITAVELGANLAEVARRNLAAYPDVQVVAGAFEDWPLPDEPFDLAFAATAFHWLEAAPALRKIASALRPGGSVAILSGGHVAGGTSSFFVDVQECYERNMPGTPPGLRLTRAEDLPVGSPEIDASGLFGPVQSRRYVWLREFTTQTYIDELGTYSSHLALDEEHRNPLLSCIRALIDDRYAGRITKAYVTDLDVARVREGALNARSDAG